MNTPDMIATIFTVVILPLLGVITTYSVSLIKAKIGEIENTKHNATLNKYLDMAEDAIVTAVQAVNQSYVDSLKQSGSFDSKAQMQAFMSTKARVLSMLSSDAKDFLYSAYGDFTSMLDTKIESYVKNLKTPVIQTSPVVVPETVNDPKTVEDALSDPIPPETVSEPKSDPVVSPIDTASAVLQQAITQTAQQAYDVALKQKSDEITNLINQSVQATPTP